jgi:hypothetical chaperone protein
VGTLVSVVLKRLKREADKAIEAAKIALSSAGATALRFSPLGPEVTVRRSAFESMIRPELDLVRKAITGALQEANVTATDVDRVLLTGGSAYIPAFRADLADTFGSDRLEQRDAFTAVVHGLGVRAQQLWGLVQTSAGVSAAD